MNLIPFERPERLRSDDRYNRYMAIRGYLQDYIDTYNIFPYPMDPLQVYQILIAKNDNNALTREEVNLYRGLQRFFSRIDNTAQYRVTDIIDIIVLAINRRDRNWDETDIAYVPDSESMYEYSPPVLRRLN